MFANDLNTTNLISRYEEAIVASNVDNIGTAKYVIFLGGHTKSKIRASDTYQIQLLFNQAMVEFLYKKNDLIVVEDSCEKEKDSLCKDQIPDLSPDCYDIGGWDDPESCQRALIIKKNYAEIKALITSVRNHTGTTLREKHENFKKLISFAELHPTEIQIPLNFATNLFHHIYTFSGNQKFIIQLKEFLVACEKCNEGIRVEFVKETFPKRQHSFIERLGLEKERPGKVYAFTGTLHCELENNPLFQEEVHKLMDFLKTSDYIILNAAKLIH